ncbi:hypothetical protein [Kitasatospora sp. NPDC058218]|uniref:hypothetical protein n=1 Tax=Kitasatospora sp. NPDC058218 TaxID=3346385 RepID=UPI0036D75D7C
MADVEITDGFLDQFVKDKIAKFIEGTNTNEAVRKIRAYASGDTPILVGSSAGAFTAPKTLSTAIKDYTGSIAAMLGTVVDQLDTLSIDLMLADRYLNNAKDEALDYAQFMTLAERTLNPGAGTK